MEVGTEICVLQRDKYISANVSRYKSPGGSQYSYINLMCKWKMNVLNGNCSNTLFGGTRSTDAEC